MKKVSILIGVLIAVFSCNSQQEDVKKPIAETDLTGNSVTYSLQVSPDYNIDGSIIFKEKKDGSALIEVKLNNLGNDPDQHPVHLHMGDLTVEKASIAAQLSPVDGKTGLSSTNLKMLSNENVITYTQLKTLNACVKVHLASYGEGQNIVLAGANIGTAVSTAANGRVSLGVCKSE